MVEGIRRLAAARYSRPVVAESKKKSVASLIALKTELSIHEAEKILDEMAQNGYTVMQVRESGRIEYEFPEFMPRLGSGAGESV